MEKPKGKPALQALNEALQKDLRRVQRDPTVPARVKESLRKPPR